MGKTIVAGVVAGVIVYGWGMVSWMAMDWHTKSWNNVPAGEVTMPALMGTLPKPGVYHYPGLPPEGSGKNWTEWGEQFKGQPYVSLLVYRDDFDMNSPRPYIVGAVINLLSGLLAAFLLTAAAQAPLNYPRRVMFVMFLGGFATFMGPATDTNWLGYPADFAVPYILDPLIAWTLAGIVLAAIIRPRSAAATHAGLGAEPSAA